MDIIMWLSKWYQSNCDGFWEHMYGIQIDSLDNSGWKVDIDLIDTLLEDREFEKIQIKNSDADWILCFVENDVFKGRGDPSKLKEILIVFKDWVENF